MGRYKTDEINNNDIMERATNLIKEMNGTAKYTVAYIMWFIKEWEEATNRLKK